MKATPDGRGPPSLVRSRAIETRAERTGPVESRSRKRLALNARARASMQSRLPFSAFSLRSSSPTPPIPGWSFRATRGRRTAPRLSLPLLARPRPARVVLGGAPPPLASFPHRGGGDDRRRRRRFLLLSVPGMDGGV